MAGLLEIGFETDEFRGGIVVMRDGERMKRGELRVLRRGRGGEWGRRRMVVM